tara:strand:+ start:86 stop:880 length:795 start_codon:yes stop_codon:yes gene_type:complete
MSKKIIITGAAGFIGSRLAEIFIEKGYEVTVFDRYNSFNSFGWLDNSIYKKDINFCFGDIRDYESVFKNFKNNKIVVHLAALVGIPYSYEAPLSYIKTNIEGTYNVLEATKKLNFDNIIITSTSEVYGTAKKIPINENHPVLGQSPYSASKIAADQLSFSYSRSFDMPIKIARPFNTYGPRQSLRAIIPQIILQLLNKKKYLYFGNLKPTRDLTYVDDTCLGFLEILKSNKLFGSVTNIGSGKEISINDLIKKISNIIGTKKKN